MIPDNHMLRGGREKEREGGDRKGGCEGEMRGGRLGRALLIHRGRGGEREVRGSEWGGEGEREW
jgi:hypothetical protein